jgi:LPXTG-motif cell wall-anchored protein
MKRMRKSALVAVMAMALVLLTFGVGLAQTPTVNVTMGLSEFKFDPAELDVQAGAEVTFNVENTGQFPHNVTFVAPDGTESNLFAEALAGGQSATGTFTFNTAGEWKMYCPVGQHEEQGMVGVVRVAAAAGSGDMAAQATPAAASGSSTASTPATLPTTGSESVAPYALAGAALVLFGAGLWLRRKVTVER